MAAWNATEMNAACVDSLCLALPVIGVLHPVVLRVRLR